MELSTHYNPIEVEQKWYSHWMSQGFFKASPHSEKEPYTIVLPPPNITGVLHMGHVLNTTLQDVLIRKARMQGKEACWVPGIDHASIATETKVVAMLQAKGIQKKDLTRNAFLAYAWEWKEKYGSIILEQIKQLGASCDWDRLHFTMDAGPSEAVKKVFIQLYEKGYIYQGKRMINWDPVGKTALADDEVNYQPVSSKLYYVRYAIVGSDQHIIIATTRPETILGDTAICIHPDDTRYQHLHGKQAIVPIANRTIPIITDTYVDKDFGTGCLKVTPAHDMNDYELGQRHGLEIIDILNEDGTLSIAAGHYIGEDRFAVREKIAQQLQAEGYLEKIEPYTSNIGLSERTHAVVEPRLSKQWFVRIQELAKPALEHVLDNTIQFHPAKFKHMYQAWLNNVRDWCISRQLWWGHQIPAFYLPDGTVIVAEDKAAALAKAHMNPVYKNLTEADIRQDEDVLDTWFSSWLWPISVFDGFGNPENQDIQYFYPTQVLVTAPEIIFFWVARMIMAGYAFTNRPPFKHVYFTGIVRDKLGKKMSKSLGNSPDPIDLIKQYGADGVRVGMLFSSPAGNDLLFDIKLCEQGRNFANKLWNAFRLIKGWEVQAKPGQPDDAIAINWFEARFNQVLSTVEEHFEQFRISDALMAIYKLIWDDFCAWYLEMVKPAYGEPISPTTYTATVEFLAKLLKILHPFMPFITEEVWHQLQPRSAQDCITVSPWPQSITYDNQLLEEAALAFTLVTEIRNIRVSAQINPKEPLSLYSNTMLPAWFSRFSNYIQKLGYISQIAVSEGPIQDSISCHVQGHAFYIPFQQKIDLEQELSRLKKDLEYHQGFLAAVTKKLSNTKFVEQAPPAVVEIERKKQSDAIAKIKVMESRLLEISGG
ncbi:MAG: valine--tRNA ligase [Candidatus Amoebophilus sp.]